MTDELELITDGDGVAIIGDSAAVDLFFAEHDIESSTIDLARFLPSASTVNKAGAAINVGSQVVANAGRWVQLSEKSAQILKTSHMMKGSADNLVRTIATNAKGNRTTAILEIVKGGSILANPAVLAGVGGIMSQLAMQKAIDDIQEYLAVIDKKVDDILRAQKDAALAEMIGVGLMLDEAMTVRQQVGRVSEVTWSKVQATGLSIAKTQAYALRQLDALAEKLEGESHVDDLAKTSGKAARTVHEWLAVLARCFQLHDALAVLELDRVLDAAPDELDRHRIGLKTARENRRDLIVHTTTRLLARIDAVADLSDGEILRNPFSSRTVTQSVERTGADIARFHGVLGVPVERAALEAKGWTEAAVDVRDDAIAKGAEGVRVTVRVGGQAVDNVRRGIGRFAADVSKRMLKQDETEG
jgi:hypothetical protein